jgi:hypothetical protein
LDIYGVSEINEQLTSRPSKDYGIKRWVYSGEGDGVSKVATLGQFKDKLVELKSKNAFPVLIEVDAAKKPFGDGKGYGPHVVTITDYDPQTGLVSVDNQWGKGADMTGLPGQGAKPTAEVLWGSMSPVPGFDYLWGKVKDGMKEVHIKDAGPPTVRALSEKGLFWGVSAAAPLAVRGGLGYLSEWGMPGAASVLSASETRLGSIGLRAGTSLAALGAFAYINDVPGAFREGTSHGVGKMTRVTGDWASFELGAQLTNKGLSAVGLWAPVRIPISLAAGVATTTVFDRLLGEGSEIGGSWVYDRAREYFKPDSPLAAPEKAISKPPAPAHPAKLSQLGEKDMTTQFVQRYQSYDALFKK